MSTHREDLAWAAGFWDGEGYVGYDRRGMGVSLQISQVAEGYCLGEPYSTTMEKFQELFPFTELKQVLYETKSWQLQLRYSVHNFQHVQQIMASMWEWLGPIKREQWAECSRRVSLTRTKNLKATRWKHWLDPK